MWVQNNACCERLKLLFPGEDLRGAVQIPLLRQQRGLEDEWHQAQTLL